MTIRIAINGFGRIGRLILRGIAETRRDDYVVSAINDLGPPEANAHLLRHDTVHGPFPGEVALANGTIDIGNGPIRVLREKDPANLPWRELGIDIVFECSVKFRKRDQASRHLEAGACRVLVSAIAEDADLIVVYGINHQALKPEHEVVSNASCTTNCAAPIAAVLDEAIGVDNGSILTAHGYTGNQNLVDGHHRICGAPARQQHPLSRRRQAPPERSASSCPNLKAAWMEWPCVFRSPTFRSSISPSRPSARPRSMKFMARCARRLKAGSKALSVMPTNRWLLPITTTILLARSMTRREQW